MQLSCGPGRQLFEVGGGAPVTSKSQVGRVGSNPRPADYEKYGFVHFTR
jgi:hypothetical protein